MGTSAGHHHGHAGHTHEHSVSIDSDRRWLAAALALLIAYMAAEVVVGLLAHSLALITDAGHMLTDAAAIALALVAMRLAARPAHGGYTYGLKRAEILSAQANGTTLLLLAAYFVYEGIRRLIAPPEVHGALVLITALVGVVVNLAATWCIRRADRSSLNVEGAYQHILNDLFAFIATAIAGAVVWLTGFARADALAALVVAVLMLRAGWGLVRASARIFLEAAPEGIDPDAVGRELVRLDAVVEVHDLHIWEITSGQPALSAHVLVEPAADCHAVRTTIAQVLYVEHHLEHITLQVDHSGSAAHPAGHDTHALESDEHGHAHAGEASDPSVAHADGHHAEQHCSAPHGRPFRADPVEPV